jgi:hypothetical protein
LRKSNSIEKTGTQICDARRSGYRGGLLRLHLVQSYMYMYATVLEYTKLVSRIHVSSVLNLVLNLVCAAARCMLLLLSPYEGLVRSGACGRATYAVVQGRSARNGDLVTRITVTVSIFKFRT